jgi:hypothetical protein
MFFQNSNIYLDLRGLATGEEPNGLSALSECCAFKLKMVGKLRHSLTRLLWFYRQRRVSITKQET